MSEAVTDREATQDFTVFTKLVEFYGKVLTAEVIEQIRQELAAEMRTGCTAWAFKGE